MTKDRKVFLASLAQLVRQDLLEPLALRDPLARQERLALPALPVRQEQAVLQELLVPLAQRGQQAPLAQPDPSALQAQRVLRERQVQQDLKVLQETRERLDQLVP